VKNLAFAPVDPGRRELLLSLLDHYWQTDQESVTLMLEQIRSEAGSPALASELSKACFQHVMALTPSVVPILYPDGTPVTGEDGEPIYHEVAPT
jgi:hypothetical protein